MTIKTASIREINKLPKTAYKVLIMRYYPWWFKNLKKKIDEWLPILAPSKELLKDYKEELKRTQDPSKAWVLVNFEVRYNREILRNSKTLGEIRRIKRIGRELKNRRVVYLLCHEVTDEYCHRRLLKELMEKFNLGD